MNIILYGGSFNPPTNAHLAISRACLEKAHEQNGELWLIPSGDRRDKVINVSKQQRLCYLEGFVRALGNAAPVRIETSEFDSTVLTETADTVRRFAIDYPKTKFSWVFGADSIQTMRDWHGGEELWRTLKMYIIPRHGYQITELPPHAELLEITPPQVSSTEIRNMIEAGRQISDFVPAEILTCLVS